ncbi:hypothetical protein EST38_g5011 [Candolleomyces aberdarensis]|uniref:F-box domain-containing protein n=1 Tax=Candolleomyces aberdarensis TaxID=2316362 RepID=A0A4Q2DPE5_9AGAR|nr:hypothetical protein EST38_g5011 [Candolleomyces aberdarensis]
MSLINSSSTAPVRLGARLGLPESLPVVICRLCNKEHADPGRITLCTLPIEMIEEAVCRVGGPLELHALARVCPTFRRLVMQVIFNRLSSILSRVGIPDSRLFLRMLYATGSVFLAGPSLLPVLFPDFSNPGYANCLELHAPNDSSTLDYLTDHLEGHGFRLQGVDKGGRRVRALATDVLDYPYFGRTVKKVLKYTKDLGDGLTSKIYIFVNKSLQSGFLSITEYPTTLFMIAIDGVNLHVLYPELTGKLRALINFPFPRPKAFSRLPSFTHPFASFFDFKARVNDWKEYRAHICDHSTSCPLRYRTNIDNRGILLPCTPDHPDFTHRRPPAPGHIRKPTSVFPRQEVLVLWRLRCCGSCSDSMAFPQQNRGLTGPEYEKMSAKAMKAHALRHLQSGGKMLAVGHESTPQSMWNWTVKAFQGHV